jgi:hypothetical protein
VGIELSSDSLIVGVIKNGGVTLFGIVNCPVGRCSSSAGCTYTNTGTNTISAKIGKHAAFSIQQDGKLVPWAPVPFGCYTTIPGQTEFKKLMKFGVSHSLALYKTSNGQTGLTGWGSNTSGQLNFPDGITAIMAQGGLNHTVILRQNGGITAFGDNSLQQCNVNATLRAANAAKYVAAGYDFNVAILANNGLTAWGDNTYNQCNIPAGITSTKVVCGAYHALALSAGGTVFGWGRGNDPNGSCIACDCKQAVIPNEVATASGDDTIVDIEASSCQSFAVTRTGKVISWGDGNCGVDNLLPGSLNSIISGPCGVDQQGDLLMSPQNGLTLPIFFSSSYFGAVGKFTGSPEIQINEWYHLAGILKNDANNTRVLYVNDNKTTDSLAMGGCTFSPNSKIIIGGVIGNDYDWFKSNTTFDGDVSEAAIWNVELTEDELAMLRKGIKPIYVRPQNLIFYAPLTTDNVINYAAGNLLTLKINSNAVTSSTINKNSDILGNIVDHTIRYG